MEVDGQRLRDDIEANAEFGALDGEGRGRTVLTGTEANRRAREYFVERLEDARLDVRVDAVGNIAGRWMPESANPEVAAVAAGSHLDSVPEGGIFDGPLGVYAALEAVRTMRDGGVKPTRPIDVVSFTEEEGQRFADGLLGSSVATGHRSVEEALSLTDGRTTLEDALDTAGFRGKGRIDASDWDAWLELHVEQSERLERAGIPVGVVTTITGITHCDAEIVGEANHAGATPMSERTDALTAASEFVLDVERAAPNVGETAVGTVGKLDVRPNATNVVPGRVEMGVDIRDVNYEAMNEIVSRARDALDRLEAERGVETRFDREFDLEPTDMSDRCRKAAHEAAEDAGIDTVDLHSGAAHDTMRIADVTDAAMLFAPSRDGISHNPAEWTEWNDCAASTRVLAGALASLAR
ncbi:Zn-dependent hydrolase [Haladaptatus halobius]|uniref:Zn-dependent hydrolase n=1 Tax=Haladaptatus halobius TaxID=2884875 RepID=UPI001D09D712|nr:Zn-dependent hydrolase [Haladaptatus halobius]